ncbi:hypothetical protein I6E68_04765 [Salinibacterium sp. NSLL150]|uniref:hypothetical protein n=1 Tax=unclassified Salinibacterium TaxID=2632331 RepID=UPI0018CF219B|nr:MULTISPECIES: hypothetical protein [unclassified Salinibacterium]MBH0098452.1 hypothetical protein [Salinibacterium sp. NSLL35]MBH0101207.1 hypothetical protein [Salinibacterium sp. NSLL150]MBH0103966.1 hypothetical protein [Salinibacterium sp. NSLL16]MBH0106727.1 hypothetical protein [Salinibacterium sp. NSLL17]
MTKTRRALATAALGAVAMMSLSGCLACSAVGYVNNGPAVIELEDALHEAEMLSACFGEECVVQPVTRSDGKRWEVPQEPPYVDDSVFVLGGERSLHVVVSDRDGFVISDATYEIPVSVERRGLFGQCSGPVSFEPVLIEARQ